MEKSSHIEYDDPMEQEKKRMYVENQTQYLLMDITGGQLIM